MVNNLSVKIVEGYSNSEDAKYCPVCGSEIGEWHGPYGVCDCCGTMFAVIIHDDDELESDHNG